MRTLVIALTLACGLATALDAQPLAGGVHTVTTIQGNTLRQLGSRFGVDPATIASDNNRELNPPLHAGETLRIDNRHIVPAFMPGAMLIINVPQRMLFVRTTDGNVSAYPVTVGKASWPTPVGSFSIAKKETNPTWEVPASIQAEARRAGRSLPRSVPPGPRNPLGAHWLGLHTGSVGIHGTNAPTSIYQMISHGCIRLHPDDIAALFDVVPVGATGSLVYQPVLVAVDGSDVYLEVHRDTYGRGPEAIEFVKTRTQELGVFDRVDWDVVAQVIHERSGTARRVSR
jgi:L,D-transpeptidase ErfK/SrfK